MSNVAFNSIWKGSKIEFAEEIGRPYKVMAIGERWAVLSRPMQQIDRDEWKWEGEDCPVYTIVDNKTMRRGPHNLIMDVYDFATEEGCEQVLRDLEAKKIALSARFGRSIPIVTV